MFICFDCNEESNNDEECYMCGGTTFCIPHPAPQFRGEEE